MNRVALITGGAKGIGRAIALALAAEGWSVALCYRTSTSAAEQTCAELREAGAQAFAMQADVSQPAACKALIQRVHGEFGSIDALFNCAGPYHRRALLDETHAGWHAMFDNNLHPVFYLSQEIAPIFRQQGSGRMVNFSLVNADRLAAQPFITAHYIAKAGVLMLTQTLAKVLGPDGVTVNCISPGFIDSGSQPLEELEKKIPEIPAGHLGSTDDVVAAARFLVSEEARYINGANLTVSGGWGL